MLVSLLCDYERVEAPKTSDDAFRGRAHGLRWSLSLWIMARQVCFGLFVCRAV